MQWGDKAPSHGIPWLGATLQLSLLTSPLRCSFGNGLGSIPMLAVPGDTGECLDTPSCPSPTASHGWAVSMSLFIFF